MIKKKFPLTHPSLRSILTDMLPFEVPPTFSNRGFHRFLFDHEVKIEGKSLCWKSSIPAVDLAIKLLFGIKFDAPVSQETKTSWGKGTQIKSIAFSTCKMETIPFNFQIAHGTDSRSLSVVHPRNQVSVAAFYVRYSSLIIYYSSLSSFSIRRPVSISRFVYFKDRLHEQKLESSAKAIETDDREYEHQGMFFVYREHRNIHRFFESYKYHQCEKKYNAMVRFDISKCFDSIYTHSLPWATMGKAQVKFALEKSKGTFAGRFDALMTKLNFNETNGIVIGPEFSRVFAEILLQSVDVELLHRLATTMSLTHCVDYEIFRYVDDYFVFYNEPKARVDITEMLQIVLKEKKLNINAAKIKNYEKPIITEITIAKERISTLLNVEIDPQLEVTEGADGKPDSSTLKCVVNPNRLIIKYKTVIKSSQVNYEDLLNYTLAIAENKIEKLLEEYRASDQKSRDQKCLLRALLAIVEFAFFIYSASPKVNHTIRICRMIQTAVDFLRSSGVTLELRHLLFKYIHDNILELLNKHTMNIHHEVESLYFLTALSQIGKEYRLPESTLARYLCIEKNSEIGTYFRKVPLNHFSITVLLLYMGGKDRYHNLRSFIEQQAIEKVKAMKSHCKQDSECLMLFLDLLVCPDVSVLTKQTLAAAFDIAPKEMEELRDANERWFTVWGPKFDLGEALDAKRSREVY